MEENQFEREEIYSPPVLGNDRYSKFTVEFNNINFRYSKMTTFSLIVLLLFVAQGLMGDQTDLLKSFNEPMRILTYIFTIGFQWLLFLMIYFAVSREKTFLAGIGLVRFRGIDIAWGSALLLSLFAVAAGVSVLLTWLGYPPKGELAFLLPQETLGKFLWVLVSFTAGFCEEVLFRGYLMTRIRILGKFKSWVVPVIVSSLAFGFPHFYQGVHGFLLISVLGVLFALVYIRTKSLWPCILAHFLMDLIALIVPME